MELNNLCTCALIFRGKPLFEKALGTFLSYLDAGVPHVGISFLFSRANIHEYAEVARLVYNLVKKEKPQHLHKGTKRPPVKRWVARHTFPQLSRSAR